MAFWITLKKAKVRQGFSAATAKEAYAVLVAKKREGYEEVRIIHPDGYEVSVYALEVAIERDLSETISRHLTRVDD